MPSSVAKRSISHKRKSDGMSEPPNKDKRLQHQSHGWFASKPHSYLELVKHSLVEQRIKRYREGESQECYVRALERMLEARLMTVEELLALPPDGVKKAVFSAAMRQPIAGLDDRKGKLKGVGKIHR